jgi:RHS repeat-associated protein
MTSTVPGSIALTDTLGQSVTASGNGSTQPITYTYTSAAGSQVTATVNYTPVTIQTNFGCPGVAEAGPYADYLPGSLALPDGTSYNFTYEVTPGDIHTPHYVTGRLASVTLPTGGTISYTYTGGNSGVICADGSPAGLTRTTPDGTWTYTRSGSAPAWTTTMTDPQGNQTVMNFQGIYETERQAYQGSTSGTLLQTVYTCYNGAAHPCNNTAISLPIAQITVTNAWASGQTSQTVSSYNTYGLPTEVDEYGYGSGSVGSLIRKTLTSYASLGNNINDRPSSVAVYAAGASNPSSQTTYNYDQGSVTATSGTPQHVSVSGARGNVTTTTYNVTTSSTISTTTTYFDTGMEQTRTDSNGNQFTYAYGSASCGNSFATSISMPLSLSWSQTWNCNGGLIASKTDENVQVTNYSYDLLNRPAQINYPDGGWDLMSYTGANQLDSYKGITDTTPSMSCTSCTHTQRNLDSQGRESTSVLVSDPEGQTTASTSYDSLGRTQKTSSPYRSTSDPTYGFTTGVYDALDRATSVTHQDGNVVNSYYGSDVGTHGGANSQLCSSSTYGLGYPFLSVDEMAMKHQGWSDGLGREIEADEPDSSNNMTLGTCYAYDALGNLTQAVQGNQTRTYAYDMLSRKTSETIPEAGTTNFYYTTSGGSLCSGNVTAPCRRTDARGITTTVSYDALNRTTSKSYSDSTPTANFYHDEATVTVAGSQYTLTNTKGRLSHTSASSGSAMTLNSYDKMGRTQDLWQCTPYNCSSASIWNVHYSYDLAGDTPSWKNADGNTFTHTISNARRITQITSSVNDSTHPGTLAQNIKYAPHGAVNSLQNGCAGTGCTQRQETYDYNNRLQAVRIQLGTSATPNGNSCFVYNYYHGVGNPTSCAIPSQGSSGNNGSAMGHYFQDTTNPGLGHTISYSYDNMMRLGASVAAGSSAHNLTFSYDRYGNMTCSTNQNTNGPCPNYSFNASTNQINNTGFTYDAAGNLTADGTGTGTHTYHWDAENRLTSIDNGSTATYTYNALGERVEKNVAGAYTEYVYHPSGEEVGENNRSSWMQIIPLNGRHLAHYQNGAYFMHTNSLGSTSQVTDYTGNMAQDQLYYPWGQEWSMVGTSVEKRFAKLRHRDETETGLDPTHYRMFSSTQGRWLSKDPVPGQPCTPQSMNLYAYVQNTPTKFVDPKGLLPFYPGDGGGPCDPFLGPCDYLPCCYPFEPPFDCISCYPPPPIFGSGGGGGAPDCTLTMAIASVPFAGYFCDGQLSRATARLVGPFELVTPKSVRFSVKKQGSVDLVGQGDFATSNFTWRQDYRAFRSRKPASITFTAKYSCSNGGNATPATSTLTIDCTRKNGGGSGGGGPRRGGLF